FSCGVTAPTPPSRMHEFLWGCTGSGIILTDLSRIRHVRVPPSVYITGVLANGSEVDINSPLRLKYNMNTVTFHFAGISLRDEGSLKYRYILHGADERWTSVSGRLPVTYVSLRPGYYTFEVKAVSPAGIESKSVASLAFAIIPPIWQRWWFLLISGITLAYVVYYSIRLRVRRLLEIERVRGRIATDLHDEIGSGLTRIAILADVALRQTESPEAVSPEANALQMQDNKESFSTHNLVHKIGVNARDLVDSMSDVVWSIDPKNATVADLVTRFRSFAYEMCEAKGINLQFATDSDLKSLPLDPVIMRALLIITKEALNNSVKHSGCKNLSIGIKSMKNQISLLISDDGRGFPVESHSSGHGLGNMRARAEKLGGEYKLKSSPGDGTTIQVTVPANA
ncbi:MAG TPA: ATP-binding protein, partial [Candidatus Kryptobacter bacterium]|nr:ATP-binding protein [Candidatus Kryptobacter bacterium]